MLYYRRFSRKLAPIQRAAPSRSFPLSTTSFKKMIDHGRIRCDIAALQSRPPPGQYPPNLCDILCRTTPPANFPLVSYGSLLLRLQQCSCTNLFRIPLCLVSCLRPPLSARAPCFLSRQALSRWSHSPPGRLGTAGGASGSGFSFIQPPGVSCALLPAGVSPWWVVFSAFVISHVRSRASSRT